MVLYRGPQFTQDVAQYPSYRPFLLSISWMHALQVAISGGIIPESDPGLLGSITKPPGIIPASGRTSTVSILDIGGPRETACKNF